MISKVFGGMILKLWGDDSKAFSEMPNSTSFRLLLKYQRRPNAFVTVVYTLLDNVLVPSYAFPTLWWVPACRIKS